MCVGYESIVYSYTTVYHCLNIVNLSTCNVWRACVLETSQLFGVNKYIVTEWVLQLSYWLYVKSCGKTTWKIVMMEGWKNKLRRKLPLVGYCFFLKLETRTLKESLQYDTFPPQMGMTATFWGSSSLTKAQCAVVLLLNSPSFTASHLLL